MNKEIKRLENKIEVATKMIKYNQEAKQSLDEDTARWIKRIEETKEEIRKLEQVGKIGFQLKDKKNNLITR